MRAIWAPHSRPTGSDRHPVEPCRHGYARGSPFELSSEAQALLARRVERSERARRERAPALAAVTVSLPADLDLSAAVLSAQAPDDRFFCFEQPDRDGFVLAGLGCAIALESRGAGRFREVAVRARDLGRRAFVDDVARGPRPPGRRRAGVRGWLRLRRPRRSDSQWSSLAPASLVLPELSLARIGGGPDDRVGGGPPPTARTASPAC